MLWNISDASLGTEELAHWEMLGTMIYQCMRGASYAQIDEAGMAGYYTMHSRGVFPADPNGVPFTTAYIACTGDPRPERARRRCGIDEDAAYALLRKTAMDQGRRVADVAQALVTAAGLLS